MLGASKSLKSIIQERFVSYINTTLANREGLPPDRPAGADLAEPVISLKGIPVSGRRQGVASSPCRRLVAGSLAVGVAVLKSEL